jgi:DNA-binding CsgD family transcriptional regulator/tetratricopeptide (TPR) repeat protein
VLGAFAEAALHDVVVVAAAPGYGKSVALRRHLDAIRTPGIIYEVRRDFTVVDVFRALATLAGASEGLPEMVRAVAERGLLPYAARWLCERIDARGWEWIALDDLGSASADVLAFASELLARQCSFRWYAVVGDPEDLRLDPVLADGRLGPIVDADVLSFDVKEIGKLSRRGGVSLTGEQALSLKLATGGWPVAVSIALQHRAESGFDEGVLPRAQDALSRYVAERARAGLGESERELLSWAPYVPLRAELLEHLGFADARKSMRRLSALSPLLRATDNGFVVHDVLMTAFADSEASQPSAVRAEKWCRAGDAYLSLGEHAESLRAYLQGNDPQRIARLLCEAGDYLSERGFGADIARALTKIPLHVRRAEPALLLLEATAEVERGRLDVAEELYRLASVADGEIGRIAAVRLATQLVNRGRPGAADVLRPVAIAHPTDAEVQSAFAVALSAAGNFADLGPVVESGVRAARRSTDTLVSARAWQRLGLAAHFAGDWAVARERCRTALEIATRKGFDGGEARIRSLLYNIAVAEDDYEAAIGEAKQMVTAARRAGQRQLEIAGLNALLINAAEAGDDAGVDDIEAQLVGLGPARGYADAFLSALARALAETRRGRLATAATGLERIVAEGEDPPEVIACADAVSALLALARGSSDSRERLKAARLRMVPSRPDPRATSSHVVVLLHAIIAVADAACGHRAHAARSAREALRIARTARDQSLAKATHHLAHAENASSWLRGTMALRVAGLGGYAALFDLLRSSESPPETVALSTAEREILRLYGQRRQAKEIASLLNRNVETVRTHIRNGTRKLRVNGREALIDLIAASPALVEVTTQR